MIRNVSWTDILRILATRRQQQILRLNPPYTIIQPETVLADLVRAQSPVARRRCHTLVYLEDGDLLAYLQARCRWQRRDEWTITSLATTVRDGDPLWGRLLAEVIRQAGEHGITRVFAKLPVDDPRLALFRELGFAVYSHERIWGDLYLKGVAIDSPPRGPLRGLENRDAFDLLQLYRQVTPQVVQQAEALTSKQWQPGPRLAPGGLGARAFVWDTASVPHDGTFAPHGVGGWVRLLTGPRGHWITTLFRPEQRAVARDGIDYVVWLARKSAPKPMYVALREYQAELEPLLEDRGFHLLTEQALLVKYTAVLDRKPVPAFALQRAGRLVVSDWTISRADPHRGSHV
ncbi:MAG TPA: GNAT family N-acetyltransferase [Chloroflexia bacterium]|nr:GNAT family N-acetyltransferase [Chloroflexia bacterium]